MNRAYCDVQQPTAAELTNRDSIQSGQLRMAHWHCENWAPLALALNHLTLTGTRLPELQPILPRTRLHRMCGDPTIALPWQRPTSASYHRRCPKRTSPSCPSSPSSCSRSATCTCNRRSRCCSRCCRWGWSSSTSRRCSRASVRSHSAQGKKEKRKKKRNYLRI